MDAGPLTFRRQHREQLRRLGSLLQEYRVKAGLRQIDLAARLGRSQSYVAKFETGERRLDLYELQHVCEALGISLQGFVRRFQS